MIVRRHLFPLLALAAVTALWLAPLVSHLSTVLPGPDAGDNATFVWNLWWMRYVLHHEGQSFFHTTFLFHPMGADLTLHTHTALPALVAAVAGPSSVIAAQNLLIVADFYLNFACSYALAFRLTRRIAPALLASLIFGCSTFVCAHVWGHFNLIAAWTLPLAWLLAQEASDYPSLWRAALGGLVLAAIAYIDYYLFVYAGILTALFWFERSIVVSAKPARMSRARRLALSTLVALLAIDAAAIAAILLSDSDRVEVGPWRISIQSVNNPVTAAWILGVAAIVLVVLPKMRIRLTLPSWPERRVMIVTTIAAMAVLLPLVVRGFNLWSAGRYVSQPYQWRSAPGGIDVATFLLGNPFHLVWGERVRRVYATWQIDPIEASGWTPIAALLLSVIALAMCWREAAVRRAALFCAVFMIWALGPWLVAFGSRTPVLLPAIAVRYVPIVANARIPGRAMAVVYLGVAMLAAIGAASLLARKGRARLSGFCLGGLVLLECLPARPPVFRPDMLTEYAALKDRMPAGAVCELPMGIRDGFGEVGDFDSAVLLHQSVHERPIVGGFLARLPPTVGRDYEAMPVIGSFLRLSSGARLSDEHSELTPTEAASALESLGVAFVVLDTRRASPDLIAYVQSRIALRRIAEEDGRIFFRAN